MVQNKDLTPVDFIRIPDSEKDDGIPEYACVNCGERDIRHADIAHHTVQGHELTVFEVFESSDDWAKAVKERTPITAAPLDDDRADDEELQR